MRKEKKFSNVVSCNLAIPKTNKIFLPSKIVLDELTSTTTPTPWSIVDPNLNSQTTLPITTRIKFVQKS